jgi:hypothetical protein
MTMLLQQQQMQQMQQQQMDMLLQQQQMTMQQQRQQMAMLLQQQQQAQAMAEALAVAEARVPAAMPPVSPVLQNLLALEAQAARVPAAIASAANALAIISPAASASTAVLVSEPARPMPSRGGVLAPTASMAPAGCSSMLSGHPPPPALRRTSSPPARSSSPFALRRPSSALEADEVGPGQNEEAEEAETPEMNFRSFLAEAEALAVSSEVVHSPWSPPTLAALAQYTAAAAAAAPAVDAPMLSASRNSAASRERRSSALEATAVAHRAALKAAELPDVGGLPLGTTVTLTTTTTMTSNPPAAAPAPLAKGVLVVDKELRKEAADVIEAGPSKIALNGRTMVGEAAAAGAATDAMTPEGGKNWLAASSPAIFMEPAPASASAALMGRASGLKGGVAGGVAAGTNLGVKGGVAAGTNLGADSLIAPGARGGGRGDFLARLEAVETRDAGRAGSRALAGAGLAPPAPPSPAIQFAEWATSKAASVTSSLMPRPTGAVVGEPEHAEAPTPTTAPTPVRTPSRLRARELCGVGGLWAPPWGARDGARDCGGCGVCGMCAAPREGKTLPPLPPPARDRKAPSPRSSRPTQAITMYAEHVANRSRSPRPSQTPAAEATPPRERESGGERHRRHHSSKSRAGAASPTAPSPRAPPKRTLSRSQGLKV